MRGKMQILRVLIPLLLAIGLLLSPYAAGGAYASDQPPLTEENPPDHQLACMDGECSLRIDLGEDAPAWLPAAGFALTVLEDNLSLLPGDSRLTIDDGVSLNMPVGKLNLSDAHLDVTMGEDGLVDTFFGTAKLPTPSLAFMGLPLPLSKQAIATTIGYDKASELPSMDLPLDPDKKYLYFELASGTELQTTVGEAGKDTLWLTVPEGQKATVLLDPQERFAYVEGNITLRYSGATAFLTQIMDPAETVELFSGELPIRHQATVHVSGVLSDDLANSELQFAGRYSVDGGKLGEMVKLNGEPLSLEGGLVISEAGVLGTGVIRSTLLPENVWDSAVQAQVFMPFSTDFRNAYVALNSSVNIPFANVSADGYAKLSGAFDVVADGSYSVPWHRNDIDLMAETTSDDSGAASAESALDEAELATVDSAIEDGRWARIWRTTAEGVQVGIDSATPAAKTAADWAKQSASSGYESAADGIGWTIDMTSNQWCSTTGFCKDRGTDADATAMR